METFESMFKDDFIRHIVEHNPNSKTEAEELWNKYGEEYIENMYQTMSDDIAYYVNAFIKEQGIKDESQR